MIGQEERKGEKRDEGNASPRKPIIIRILRALKRHSTGAKRRSENQETEHAKNERMMAEWTRRVGVFTIVLACIAAISAIIFFFQLETMSGQLTEVKIANQLLKESYVNVQRAFITVPEINVRPIGPHWTFAPVIENSGNTPTKNLAAIETITFGPTVPTPGWNIRYPGIDLPKGPQDPEDVYILFGKQPFRRNRFLIGPHNKKEVGGSGIPIEDINKITDGKWMAASYGVIHYFDVFASSREHITKFCYVIGGIQSGKPVVGLCDHWNCADEECKRDRHEWEEEIEAAFHKAGKAAPPDAFGLFGRQTPKD